MKKLILLLLLITINFAQDVTSTQITENNLKEAIFYSQIVSGNAVYVGESDATVGTNRNGYSIQSRVNTITKAITQANALTPGSGNQVTIFIMDGRTYTETETLPDYVDLILFNATASNITAGTTSSAVYQMGTFPSVNSVFGRTGAVVAATSDYDAIQVDNTPAGGIAATNAQAAIDELDTEKANLLNPTFTSDITVTDSAKFNIVKISSNTTVGGNFEVNKSSGQPIVGSRGVTNWINMRGDVPAINRITGTSLDFNRYTTYPTTGFVATDFKLTSSGGAEFGGNVTASGVGFYNQTTTPTMGSNQAAIYSKDVSGTAEMFVKDEVGNETQLSGNRETYPIDVEASENYAYVTHKQNVYLGIETYIAENRAIELLQELAWENGLLDTNKYIIKHNFLEPEKIENWDDNQEAIYQKSLAEVNNYNDLPDSIKATKQKPILYQKQPLPASLQKQFDKWSTEKKIKKYYLRDKNRKYFKDTK